MIWAIAKKYCLFKRVFNVCEYLLHFWTEMAILIICFYVVNQNSGFNIILQRFNKSFWQISKLILRPHFWWGLGETRALTKSSWSSCGIYKLVLRSIGLIIWSVSLQTPSVEQIVWIAVAFLYIGKIVGRIFCSELLQENKNSFL